MHTALVLRMLPCAAHAQLNAARDSRQAGRSSPRRPGTQLSRAACTLRKADSLVQVWAPGQAVQPLAELGDAVGPLHVALHPTSMAGGQAGRQGAAQPHQLWTTCMVKCRKWAVAWLGHR